MKKVAWVFLCCMASLAIGARGAWAAELCVSKAADLQTALTTAQSNGEDNVIMVVQGTYTGNFTYNSSSGKSITLGGGYTAKCASLVLNPAKTILDGTHTGIVLSLYDSNGGNMSVEEFTIRNGNTTVGGGGIWAWSDSNSGTGGTITLMGNSFTGNTGGQGGGVCAYSYSNSGTGGTINLAGNTFTGNYAYTYGGGVWAYSDSNSGAGGPITLTWNTFTGNTAESGGGAYAESYGQTGSGQIIFYENTFKGNYAYQDGGGVWTKSYSYSGTGGLINLMENTITGNYAYTSGGGVWAYSVSGSGTGGVLSLTENTITGNYAYYSGGGVWTESYSDSGTGGLISLMENTVTGNYAYDTGGGVWAYSLSNSGTLGAIDLAQNTISGNTAYGEPGGAGVYLITDNGGSGTGGTIILTRNTVANNHAYVSGGGVYYELDAYSSGTTGAVTFEANTITGNIANGSFGGIYATAHSYSSGATGPVTFTNNIIAANTASNVGGVYAYSYSSSGTTGAITFINNTITKNTAVYDQGGVQVAMSNNTFNCYNNIIWGNTGNTNPSGADIAVNGTGTAYGYNNDYNAMYGSWNGGSAGNIHLDPLLDAGGHYHLTHTSPCIDAGYTNLIGQPATDIDGNNREINNVVDIGAHEYNGSLIAKAPADGTAFVGASLINKYQPTFQWIAVEPFKSFSILFSTSPTDFSTKGVFITQGSASGTSSSWTPPIATWEKIMSISYNGGGVVKPIYWKVAGTAADKSTPETPVRQFSAGSIAFSPTIQSPADGAILSVATPPAFVFYTAYNTKFRLEISPLIGFGDPKEIIAYTYTVTNPVVTPILQETLSSSQWTAVKNLVGTGLAETGYFRIRAWDGLNRESDSPTQSFKIQ